MYSLVLMMALGNGATAPSIDATERPTFASFANHNHTLNRGRGCHGCHGCYGCHGCWGCYGCSCYGCYGCWSYGCYGCWGGCWGCHCYGGYGSFASYGSYPVVVARADAPATIVVTLPADAKLTVNDQPTNSTTDRRTFVSPPLQNGSRYYYTLKAEMNRDGRPVTSTKEVIVQAGKETEVKFELDTSTVALR